jgi:hypothetical protein
MHRGREEEGRGESSEGEMTYRPKAPQHYVLDDNNVPQRATWLEAARFFSVLKRRRVGWDKVGGYVVSTVFLGLDHQFGRGPPLLFETMIFADDAGKGGAEDYQRRYSTWDDAFLGHRAKVRELEQAAAHAIALLEKVK